MDTANPLNDPPKYTAEEAALIEKVKREFSAADLQRYTEDDEDQLIPIEDVLAELAKANAEANAKPSEP